MFATTGHRKCLFSYILTHISVYNYLATVNIYIIFCTYLCLQLLTTVTIIFYISTTISTITLLLAIVLSIIH